VDGGGGARSLIAAGAVPGLAPDDAHGARAHLPVPGKGALRVPAECSLCGRHQPPLCSRTQHAKLAQLVEQFGPDNRSWQRIAALIPG
jgi:hypothetical protein